MVFRFVALGEGLEQRHTRMAYSRDHLRHHGIGPGTSTQFSKFINYGFWERSRAGLLVSALIHPWHTPLACYEKGFHI